MNADLQTISSQPATDRLRAGGPGSTTRRGASDLPDRASLPTTGVTPFGTILSAVQWSDRTEGGTVPRPAADQMFDAPPSKSSYRQRSTSRGNDARESRIAAQSSAKKSAVTKRDDTATLSNSTSEFSTVPSPTNLQPAAAPIAARTPGTTGGSPTGADGQQAGAAHQNVNPSARSDRTILAEAHTEPAGGSLDSRSNADAPPGSVTPSISSSSAIRPAGGTEPGSDNLARQVGRILAEGSRPDGAKSDAPAPALPSIVPARDHAARTKPGSAPADAPISRESAEGGAPDDTHVNRFSDLIRSIRVSAGEKNSSARLRLHPPELGHLHVDLRLDNDLVSIDVRTETEEARRRISEQVSQLKSALENSGINVDRLTVAVDHAMLDRTLGSSAAALFSDGRRNSEGETLRPTKPNRQFNRVSEEWIDLGPIGGWSAGSAHDLGRLPGFRRIDVRV